MKEFVQQTIQCLNDVPFITAELSMLLLLLVGDANTEKVLMCVPIVIDIDHSSSMVLLLNRSHHFMKWCFRYNIVLLHMRCRLYAIKEYFWCSLKWITFETKSFSIWINICTKVTFCYSGLSSKYLVCNRIHNEIYFAGSQ